MGRGIAAAVGVDPAGPAQGRGDDERRKGIDGQFRTDDLVAADDGGCGRIGGKLVGDAVRQALRHLVGWDDDIEHRRQRARLGDQIGRGAPEQRLRHGLQRVAFEPEQRLAVRGEDLDRGDASPGR